MKFYKKKKVIEIFYTAINNINRLKRWALHTKKKNWICFFFMKMITKTKTPNLFCFRVLGGGNVSVVFIYIVNCVEKKKTKRETTTTKIVLRYIKFLLQENLKAAAEQNKKHSSLITTASRQKLQLKYCKLYCN